MQRREVNITSVVAGILFIVLGLLFLLERAGVLEVRAAYVWPLVLISLGVGILLGGSRRGRDEDRPRVVEGRPVDRFWEERAAQGHPESPTETSAQVSLGEEPSSGPTTSTDKDDER